MNLLDDILMGVILTIVSLLQEVTINILKIVHSTFSDIQTTIPDLIGENGKYWTI